MLVFIVGDGAPDVPLIDVSVSISFVFFYTMFGAKIYNIVCFFSFVTNPSPAASMSGCRGRRPYTFVYTVCPPQNRCRSLRILLCIRNYKSGAEICSPTPLCFGLQLCTSSFIILHRLVGLRLLRLCLKLRQGFAHFL